MHPFSHLRGVYAAALTPLNSDFSPGFDQLPAFLRFLAERGCHGALLMGTTGEGTSFSGRERLDALRAALSIRSDLPEFRLLLGVGSPSLQDTVEMTRAAFELGADGVVSLPPYYYQKVTDDGLFAWFAHVIRSAVPEGRALLGYHIPSITGIPLSVDLLARLKEAFPTRFAGIKDSSADPEQAPAFGRAFGDSLLVLNGTDSLFSLALENGAGGCITAMANLRSPDLRQVWDAYTGEQPSKNGLAAVAQKRLEAGRTVMNRFPPNPPLYKALIARWHRFPHWMVRPPLLPHSSERIEAAARDAIAEVEAFAG